jgi:hypothetical protein
VWQWQTTMRSRSHSWSSFLKLLILNDGHNVFIILSKQDKCINAIFFWIFFTVAASKQASKKQEGTHYPK